MVQTTAVNKMIRHKGHQFIFQLRNAELTVCEYNSPAMAIRDFAISPQYLEKIQLLMNSTTGDDEVTSQLQELSKIAKEDDWSDSATEILKMISFVTAPAAEAQVSLSLPAATPITKPTIEYKALTETKSVCSIPSPNDPTVVLTPEEVKELENMLTTIWKQAGEESSSVIKRRHIGESKDNFAKEFKQSKKQDNKITYEKVYIPYCKKSLLNAVSAEWKIILQATLARLYHHQYLFSFEIQFLILALEKTQEVKELLRNEKLETLEVSTVEGSKSIIGKQLLYYNRLFPYYISFRNAKTHHEINQLLVNYFQGKKDWVGAYLILDYAPSRQLSDIAELNELITKAELVHSLNFYLQSLLAIRDEEEEIFPNKLKLPADVALIVTTYCKDVSMREAKDGFISQSQDITINQYLTRARLATWCSQLEIEKTRGEASPFSIRDIEVDIKSIDACLLKCEQASRGILENARTRIEKYWGQPGSYDKGDIESIKNIADYLWDGNASLLVTQDKEHSIVFYKECQDAIASYNQTHPSSQLVEDKEITTRVTEFESLRGVEAEARAWAEARTEACEAEARARAEARVARVARAEAGEAEARARAKETKDTVPELKKAKDSSEIEEEEFKKLKESALGNSSSAIMKLAKLAAEGKITAYVGQVFPTQGTVPARWWGSYEHYHLHAIAYQAFANIHLSSREIYQHHLISALCITPTPLALSHRNIEVLLTRWLIQIAAENGYESAQIAWYGFYASISCIPSDSTQELIPAKLPHMDLLASTSRVVTKKAWQAFFHPPANSHGQLLARVRDQGYSLVVMPASDSPFKLEDKKIYIIKTHNQKDLAGGGALRYHVRGPSGKIVSGIITAKELGCSISADFTPATLDKILLDILEVTLKRGHTPRSDDVASMLEVAHNFAFVLGGVKAHHEEAAQYWYAQAMRAYFFSNAVLPEQKEGAQKKPSELLFRLMEYRVKIITGEGIKFEVIKDEGGKRKKEIISKTISRISYDSNQEVIDLLKELKSHKTDPELPKDSRQHEPLYQNLIFSFALSLYHGHNTGSAIQIWEINEVIARACFKTLKTLGHKGGTEYYELCQSYGFGDEKYRDDFTAWAGVTQTPESEAKPRMAKTLSLMASGSISPTPAFPRAPSAGTYSGVGSGTHFGVLARPDTDKTEEQTADLMLPPSTSPRTYVKGPKSE